LGYRFDKDFWGKGYATELAVMAIKFGFNELDKNEIYALVSLQIYLQLECLKSPD
jgi:RimJ/RimL family protein N-acetyltransferase